VPQVSGALFLKEEGAGRAAKRPASDVASPRGRQGRPAQGQSLLVDIAVLAEPDELDKGAIVYDHGCSDAFRRRPGRIDDFLALESSLEVVDFECHMGHGLDELGQGTGLLEPHPLHAVRAGTETRHVEAILSEMSLSWVLDVGWNADVVIAPATLRYRGWGLMAESAVRLWVLGGRHSVFALDELGKFYARRI